MKKFFISSIFLLTLAFIILTPALAQTDTGPTPGSFWYGITTTFENANLFFTFSSEKKAKKALSYADRRLTQAKVAAESENTKAVKIALADYEVKIALASKLSRKIKDDERAEKLLTSIADNTSKHQEVLSEVLERVSEETREAIIRAIEVSGRGQKEATQHIAELKGEIEQLRQEMADLQAREKESEERAAEQSDKQPSPPIIPLSETFQPQTSIKTTSIITLPSGAIVEIDAGGKIIRTIQEAPQQVTPAPTILPTLTDQYGITDDEWKEYAKVAGVLVERNMAHKKYMDESSDAINKEVMSMKETLKIASKYAIPGSVLTHRINVLFDNISETEQLLWHWESDVEKLIAINNEIVKMINSRNGAPVLIDKINKSSALTGQMNNGVNFLSSRVIQHLKEYKDVLDLLGI